MTILIGITLALTIGGFAHVIRLDRDRAFYPTVMMVIALYYVLFAVMGGSEVLLVEMAVCAGFIALAAIGFRISLWFAVVALVGHGVFDLVHPHVITNTGVPAWWPEFCSAYDVTAGAFLALLIIRAKRAVRRS